jgi:UDP-glucose 4-epimerase
MHDLETLNKVIKKPDALIHVALCWGETGPAMIENETLPSVRLIELAIKKGAGRIIYTSSTAATGYSLRSTDETAQLKPTDFYGATKGAVELFINAYSNYYPKIKFNIVRPGYTFGNPIIEGASMQPDQRFAFICKNALAKKPIELTKNDGTQFTWAGDLAKLYKGILESDTKNEIFFGMSKNFTTWEQIAKWTIKYTESKSKIKLIDKGYSDNPSIFDVRKMQKFFDLSFNSQDKLKEHIKFLLDTFK